MDNDLRRTIIIDNFQNPTNKKTIEDVYFDGEACAITTSATSIMIQKIIGKTVDEALSLMDNYYNMLDEKEYDSDSLEELNAYDEMYKQPSRKKCAMLPFETLKKAIIKHKEEV